MILMMAVLRQIVGIPQNAVCFSFCYGDKYAG